MSGDELLNCCNRRDIKEHTFIAFLPPAYVVRREGNVLTRVCLSTGGGVPVSHNALQHFPECHGAAGGGLPVSYNALQHFPECHGAARGGTLPGPAGGGGVPWPGGTLVGGGYPGQGGTLARGGTLPGGVPCPGGGYTVRTT